jgi:hypothetical protein
VCKTAIEILMDMGLYEKLIKENKAKVVRRSFARRLPHPDGDNDN